MNDIGRISDRDYRRMRRPRLWWLPFTSVMLLAFVSGVAVKGKNSKAITFEEALTTLAGNPPEEWEQLQNVGAIPRHIDLGITMLDEWSHHNSVAGRDAAIYLGQLADRVTKIVRERSYDPNDPYRDYYREYLDLIKKEIR
jgi:hypothetical protein